MVWRIVSTGFWRDARSFGKQFAIVFLSIILLLCGPAKADTLIFPLFKVFLATGILLVSYWYVFSMFVVYL